MCVSNEEKKLDLFPRIVEANLERSVEAKLDVLEQVGQEAQKQNGTNVHITSLN